MGRQVTQFLGKDTEVIDAFDMLLLVMEKLGLITADCDNRSWKMAYDRFEKVYKRKSNGKVH